MPIKQDPAVRLERPFDAPCDIELAAALAQLTPPNLTRNSPLGDVVVGWLHFCARLVERDEMVPATVAKYSQDIAHALPLFRKRLRRLNALHVLNWNQALNTQPVNGRRRVAMPFSALAALRTCLNWARRCGLSDHNPASNLRLRYRPERGKPLALDEITRFWRALDTVEARRNERERGRPNAPHYLAALSSVIQILRVLLFTGARLTEVAACRLDQIEVNRSRLRWDRGKNRKPRFIVLPPFVLRLIVKQAELARSLGSPWLFPSPVDLQAPVSKHSVWAVFKDATAIASIVGRSPHDLRHTYADTHQDLGTDLEDLRRLLGHVNEKALDIYLHNGTPPALHEAAARHEAVLLEAIHAC